MTKPITKWEYFEIHVLDWLWKQAQKAGARNATLTNKGVATRLGCTPHEASGYIQCYLGAQRRAKTETRYVLKRKHRTSRAVWSIGERTRDAHSLTAQLGKDIERRVQRALEPDLAAIALLNPRAVAPITAAIGPMVNGVMQVIAGMVAAARAAGGDAA